MRHRQHAPVQWRCLGFALARGSKLGMIALPRRSGGIGRRAGFKIRSPQGGVGSSPTSGTTFPLKELRQPCLLRPRTLRNCPRRASYGVSWP